MRWRTGASAARGHSGPARIQECLWGAGRRWERLQSDAARRPVAARRHEERTHRYQKGLGRVGRCAGVGAEAVAHATAHEAANVCVLHVWVSTKVVRRRPTGGWPAHVRATCDQRATGRPRTHGMQAGLAEERPIEGKRSAVRRHCASAPAQARSKGTRARRKEVVGNVRLSG